MIFDSEAQRQQLIGMLVQVPVMTDLASITKEEPLRPDPATAALLTAISEGTIIEEPEDDAS